MTARLRKKMRQFKSVCPMCAGKGFVTPVNDETTRFQFSHWASRMVQHVDCPLCSGNQCVPPSVATAFCLQFPAEHYRNLYMDPVSLKDVETIIALGSGDE